jgi:hypothetical protein
MYPYPHPDSPTRPDEPTLASLLVFTVLPGAVMVALAYPLYALGTGLAVLAVAAYGRTLAARLARDPGRIREVPLPGVGTLRFTVRPR